MKPIKFIQFAWVSEVMALVIVGISLIYFLPRRVCEFVTMLPLLSTMIIAQGGAAFGGPIIKQKQEAAKSIPTQGITG